MGAAIGRNHAQNRYITNCKECRTGIFMGQQAVWQRGQNIGLVHPECATGPIVSEMDTRYFKATYSVDRDGS